MVVEQKTSDSVAPIIVHLSSLSPGSPDELKIEVANQPSKSPDVHGTINLSQVERGNGQISNSSKKLIVTDGSEMVTFQRHPLDD